MTDFQGFQIDAALAKKSDAATIRIIFNDYGWDASTLKDFVDTTLASNRTLTNLCLSYNSIGDATALAIAKALESNDTLTNLNLSYTKSYMGDERALAISTALESNRTLATLNLCGCKIGSVGAAAIAKSLGCNSTLTNLYLEWNQISNAGAEAIAKALGCNSTLATLYLAWNRINCAGALAIAEALESNSTLTILDLHGNGISVAGQKAIGDAVCKNPYSIVGFTPQQIITVLWIHGGRRQRQLDGNTGPVDKLPYDVIRRILKYKVNQQPRVWDETKKMTSRKPSKPHVSIQE
jgi:hypothetical protein